MERQFYSVDEVHELTGLSKPTIYRGVNAKKIPTLPRISAAVKIPKWWVDQALTPKTQQEE